MNEKLTLTELQLIIRDSLYIALPDMYWVTAEIMEIKENFNGHCYLELVEKSTNEKNVRARVRAIIWSQRFRFLSSFFENTTGESLKEGLKILIRVKIEYHEVYGLSLIITDIDPSYTLGEMAMKRLLIIKRLEDEGIFSMNKETDFPIIPQRIAVISSKNAAGYSDFMNHLNGNFNRYIFHVYLFEAVMQGSDTEESIIRSLDRVALNLHLFDIVVIIRGGGSQTDLSWFDNYNIAYYITQFPLPVITGIGHDKDMSVIDMVAYASMKTPTAVADFIIERMKETENHLMDLSNEITGISRTIVEQYKNKLDSFRITLVPIARLMLAEIKEDLSGKIIETINIGKDYLTKAGIAPANQKSRLLSSVKAFSLEKETFFNRGRHDLMSFANASLKSNSLKMVVLGNTLEMVRPDNVLKRGYTISSIKGKIIKKSSEVSSGEIIDTRFSDGTVSSKVV